MKGLLIVNKKLLSVIAIIVLVGGGVAAYMLTRSGNEEGNNTAPAVSSSQEESVLSEATTSIRSLFGRSNSQICTYSSGEDGGTVYIAGDQRMRIDFSSTNPENGSGSMIMTADKNYFWDDASKEGYITSNKPLEGDDQIAEDDESILEEDESLNMDEEYEFTCENWRVDANIFTPPADINFTDIEAMMEQQLQQYQ